MRHKEIVCRQRSSIRIVLYWLCSVLLQCRDFVKAGAEQGQTPSDVILAADITFSCVADPQAAKDVMLYVLVKIKILSSCWW